jgi:hypothetical protein
MQHFFFSLYYYRKWRGKNTQKHSYVQLDLKLQPRGIRSQVRWTMWSQESTSPFYLIENKLPYIYLIVSNVLLMRKRFEDVGRILSGAVSLLSGRETQCFSETKELIPWGWGLDSSTACQKMPGLLWKLNFLCHVHNARHWTFFYPVEFSPHLTPQSFKINFNILIFVTRLSDLQSRWKWPIRSLVWK